MRKTVVVVMAMLVVTAGITQAQVVFKADDLLGAAYLGSNTVEYFDNSIHWYTNFILDYDSRSAPALLPVHSYDAFGFPLLGESVTGMREGTAGKYKLALGGNVFGDPADIGLRLFFLADVLYITTTSRYEFIDGVMEEYELTSGTYGAAGQAMLGFDLIMSQIFSAGAFICGLDGSAYTPEGTFVSSDETEYAEATGDEEGFSRYLFPIGTVVPPLIFSQYYYLGIFDFKLNLVHDIIANTNSWFFGRRISMDDPIVQELVRQLGSTFAEDYWYRYLTKTFGSTYFSLRALAAGADFFRPDIAEGSLNLKFVHDSVVRLPFNFHFMYRAAVSLTPLLIDEGRAELSWGDYAPHVSSAPSKTGFRIPLYAMAGVGFMQHPEAGFLTGWKATIGYGELGEMAGFMFGLELSASNNYGDVLLNGFDVTNLVITTFTLRLHL